MMHAKYLEDGKHPLKVSSKGLCTHRHTQKMGQIFSYDTQLSRKDGSFLPERLFQNNIFLQL